MKSLVVMLDGGGPSFCYYERPRPAAASPMPAPRLAEAVRYAAERGLALQLLGGPQGVAPDQRAQLPPDHVCYVPIGARHSEPQDILIVDFEQRGQIEQLEAGRHTIAILRVDRAQLPDWLEAWRALASRVQRVVLILRQIESYDEADLERYRATLDAAAVELETRYLAGDLIELNVLSDRLTLRTPTECHAGVEHLTVTPEGALHICPGFALSGEPAVGSLTDGSQIPNQRLLERDHAPICSICDAFQCRRCVHVNKRSTLEPNTPPWQLCRVRHIEREVGRWLLQRLQARGYLTDSPAIAALDYDEPFEALSGNRMRPAPAPTRASGTGPTPARRAPPGRPMADNGRPVTYRKLLFMVTEECNFRCRYCYVLDKGPRRRMPFSVARSTVDYVLTQRELFNESHATWLFFGGEPLLEHELIGEIIAYVIERSRQLEHPWATQPSFSMYSNGALYGTPGVQRLVARYGEWLDIRITLDGPPHVHDRNRVLSDGRGTYAQVVANVPLWLRQNPNTFSHMTIDHDTLPHLAESVLHLFELGIKNVRAKTVFEDVWQAGDDTIFENQLNQLGDEMLRHDLWCEHNCLLLRRDVADASAVPGEWRWCSAGKLLAVDWQGSIYPCHRFLGCTLDSRHRRSIGDVEHGIDLNRLRPFLATSRGTGSDEPCSRCEHAASCDTCVAHDYDIADTATIFQRATHICLMHKARVRANRRFWAAVDALGDAPPPGP